MHHVRGQVHVNVVRPLHTRNQLIRHIDALCMLFVHRRLNLGKRYAVLDPRQDLLRDDRVSRKRRPVRAHELLINLHDLKLVARLHEKDELLLRHDLAILSVSLCPFLYLVVVRELYARKVVRGRIANIDLIWPVIYAFFIGAQMPLQLF